jgi:uncharacterized protein
MSGRKKEVLLKMSIKKSSKMTIWDYIAISVLIVGGLAWGLMGIFQWNVITAIFNTTIARVIYSCVGLASIYSVVRYLWL